MIDKGLPNSLTTKSNQISRKRKSTQEAGFSVNKYQIVSTRELYRTQYSEVYWPTNEFQRRIPATGAVLHMQRSLDSILNNDLIHISNCNHIDQRNTSTPTQTELNERCSPHDQSTDYSPMGNPHAPPCRNLERTEVLRRKFKNSIYFADSFADNYNQKVMQCRKKRDHMLQIAESKAKALREERLAFEQELLQNIGKPIFQSRQNQNIVLHSISCQTKNNIFESDDIQMQENQVRDSPYINQQNVGEFFGSTENVNVQMEAQNDLKLSEEPLAIEEELVENTKNSDLSIHMEEKDSDLNGKHFACNKDFDQPVSGNTQIEALLPICEEIKSQKNEGLASKGELFSESKIIQMEENEYFANSSLKEENKSPKNELIKSMENKDLSIIDDLQMKESKDLSQERLPCNEELVVSTDKSDLSIRANIPINENKNSEPLKEDLASESDMSFERHDTKIEQDEDHKNSSIKEPIQYPNNQLVRAYRNPDQLLIFNIEMGESQNPFWKELVFVGEDIHKEKDKDLEVLSSTMPTNLEERLSCDNELNNTMDKFNQTSGDSSQKEEKKDLQYSSVVADTKCPTKNVTDKPDQPVNTSLQNEDNSNEKLASITTNSNSPWKEWLRERIRNKNAFDQSISDDIQKIINQENKFHSKERLLSVKKVEKSDQPSVKLERSKCMSNEKDLVETIEKSDPSNGDNSQMETSKERGFLLNSLGSELLETQAELAKTTVAEPEQPSNDAHQQKEENKNLEFPPLTMEMVKRYNEVMKGQPRDEVISKFNLHIRRDSIRTLISPNWLDDEVINFYMNLITERSELKAKQLPSVYCMNTFFMPILLQNGYRSVSRWTRNVDLFSKDIIVVPVHVQDKSHWCMAIIHMRQKTIRCYDSLGEAQTRVLNALQLYLKQESVDKRQRRYDMTGFVINNALDAPRQKNCNDCGVFSCMVAEHIARDKPLTFTQMHIPYFRIQMVLEICAGKLWH